MTVSEAMLHRLCAESDIKEVLARYCRGVDRCDAEMIRSVYHEGAIDDHGPAAFVGPGWEFADIVVASHLNDAVMTQHVISSPHIVVDGDVADVETYCVAYRLRQKGDRRVLNTVGGRYVDRFDRRNGEWRIGHRVWVRDWGTIQQVEREFPADGFNHGLRSHDDPAYHRVPPASTAP